MGAIVQSRVRSLPSVDSPTPGNDFVNGSVMGWISVPLTPGVGQAVTLEGGFGETSHPHVTGFLEYKSALCPSH